MVNQITQLATISKTSLECNLCLEPFNSSNKRPMALQCGHSFCNHCVDKVENQTVNQQCGDISKDNDIASGCDLAERKCKTTSALCPTCRRPLIKTNTNFKLSEVIDSVYQPGNDKEHQKPSNHTTTSLAPQNNKSPHKANTVPNNATLSRKPDSPILQKNHSPGSHRAVTAQPKNIKTECQLPPDIITESINECKAFIPDPVEDEASTNSERTAFCNNRIKRTFERAACFCTITPCLMASLAGCSYLTTACLKQIICYTLPYGSSVPFHLDCAATACSLTLGALPGLKCAVNCFEKLSMPYDKYWFIHLVSKEDIELFLKEKPSPEDINYLERRVSTLKRKIKNNTMELVQLILKKESTEASLYETCFTPHIGNTTERSSYLRKILTEEGIESLDWCLEQSKKNYQQTSDQPERQSPDSSETFVVRRVLANLNAT